MAGNLLLPGNIVSMAAGCADRLVKAGDGDAALLYLYLLRRGGVFSAEGARKALGWSADRLKAAGESLARLGLWDGRAEESLPATPPEPQGPPDYTAADIAKELENGGSFPHLVEEVQRQLGKLLSTADLKILYSLYDYLALPAEVILMLTTWCVEESERKYGLGRKPRMSQIRREGFIWHRLGVDTPEAADAHLRHLTALAGHLRPGPGGGRAEIHRGLGGPGLRRRDHLSGLRAHGAEKGLAQLGLYELHPEELAPEGAAHGGAGGVRRLGLAARGGTGRAARSGAGGRPRSGGYGAAAPLPEGGRLTCPTTAM